MDFLRLLEGLRTPFLNAFFAGLTYLGSEAAFFVIAMYVFWCLSKRDGYYLFLVGFFGTTLSQSLKLIFRVPRPWVLDRNFTIVESARAGAGGYSFPSGHTQTAVGLYGGLALMSEKRWLRGLCIAAVVLVPFSRMYLGVHTPLDVAVGFAIAAALVLVLRPLLLRSDENPRILPLLFAAAGLCAAASLVFVSAYPFPEDTDPDNLAEGVANAWKMAGAVAGLVLAWALDRRYIRFDTAAPWYGQALKLVLGLAVLMAAKEGLKAPFSALFAGAPAAGAARYLIVVLLAGAGWPLTFPFFARLGRKRT